MRTNLPPTQLIAERAHQLWLEHGCRHGHDLDDWLQAEAEFAQSPAQLTTHESPQHHFSVSAQPRGRRTPKQAAKAVAT